MNSLVKAALISAAVFVVLVVVLAVLLRPGGAPVTEEGPDVAEQREKTTGQPDADPGESPPPLPPVVRGDAKLTVEILDGARKRRLSGSQLMVYRAVEADRPGRVEWESGKGGTGLFELALPPGAYVVHAQCPRYKGERRQVTLSESSPQTIAFELDKGNSISGRILTLTGEPVGGARVAALQEFASPDAPLEDLLIKFIDIQQITNVTAAETVSASDGSYQLDGLGFEYYTVRAVATGFAPNEVPAIPAPRDRVDVHLDRGGDIGGVVRDASGEEIAGAEVAAYPEIESQNVFDIILAKARPPVDTAKTDEAGSFAFQTLGAGTYNFLVKARGFQQGEFMKMRVESGAAPLSFTLQRGLVVHGLVRGPNEEPVARASVRATALGTAGGRQVQPNISFDDGSVKTDETGAFVFDDLKPGKYMILCWHDLYETRQLKDIQPSAEGEEVIIRLGGGSRLKGKVLDAVTRSPIAGASVSAADVADVPKQDVSKEDGSYLLAGLKVGGRASVRVTVTAKGYGRVSREVKTRENVELEEDFELTPTGSIAGAVRNQNGDAIAGARVMARRSQSSGVDQTLDTFFTDAEGRYSLDNVEPGAGTWVDVKQGDYLEARSAAFEVVSNQAVELEPIVLRLAGSIGGKVTGPDGQPISGCMLSVLYEGDTELQRRGGGLSPSGSTNAYGEYVIKGLSAGAVSVIVKPVRYLEKRIDGVSVEEGARTELPITVEAGNSIAGRVVDGSGNPVGGAEVLARDFSRGVKELRAVSSSDGRFRVDGIVSSDVVELVVSHEEYGNFTDQRVAVGSTDLEVVLKGLATLKGTVTTPGGVAPESFVVQPQQSAPGLTTVKQLKSETYGTRDGSFEYRGLQAGTYTVQVHSPGFATTTISDVQVPEGQVVDLGRIDLRAGGTVYGSVVDGASGTPIAGARVQITQGASKFLRRDPGAAAEDGGPSSPVQITDGKGNFSFGGLKGGNLTLRVSHKDYVSREFSDVNPDVVDRSQGLSLSLDMGGQIFGTVTDSSGMARDAVPVYLIAAAGGAGGGATTNQSAKSDRNGLYQLSGVPPGAYTVKAHIFGVPGVSVTEQAEATVQLTSGGSLDVPLVLQPISQ